MSKATNRLGRQFSTMLPQAGFSLIEVMVAVLVLAVGLLGFALLQTTSVRMSKSASMRTQATNLATELLDQMRVNRLSAAVFPGQATFSIGSVSTSACVPTIGTANVSVMVTLWKCDVVRSLGDQASATVLYNDGIATVQLSWSDRGGDSTRFDVSTRL
ncbi:type IV pilus modification protein PilV [Xanthomonas nasturtii]|uniref:type IV pilus modification protein PilV n=1 Tax=Xanthomonas nasturtii TaxID=1843581 RepID=UPI002011A961|nr:type IV pilus modification protein PilV [Xanthomonas nasturtii]MCL1526646.1 type IV pilus modification protein PilV [Xanthomonas nasturtii]MCL1534267.1 type IV pilus modification protein PilV [Xanthomonas nasturtii]MCL1542917.1 type IV pilus modification protein PilV [Xanthomonas nasturtii]